MGKWFGEGLNCVHFANFVVCSPTSVTKKTAKGDVAQGELDEASQRKAETRYLSFYEAHTEPSADAQGPADFN